MEPIFKVVLFPEVDCRFSDSPTDYRTHDVGLFHDPYQRLRDGQLVGSDGFNVPRSFAEFNQQFPNHVHQFVRRHMGRSSEADREDRESELNIFLMTLPEGSKFREPGTNGYPGGCQDRVQTFDPDLGYGAGKARFLNFINHLLLNFFITLAKRSHFQPVERQDNFTYDPETGNPLPSVDDEFLFNHLVPDAPRIGVTPEPSRVILLKQFKAFIRQHSPELLAVYQCLLAADTYLKAQQELGMDEQLFTRARNRLEVLVRCFHRSRRVPRQRKLYKLRPKYRHLRAAAVPEAEPLPAPPPPVPEPVPEVTELAVEPPEHRAIEAAAYFLWIARGSPAGQAVRCWLDAETALRSRARAPALAYAPARASPRYPLLIPQGVLR